VQVLATGWGSTPDISPYTGGQRPPSNAGCIWTL